MDILLTHTSALEALRRCDARRLPPLAKRPEPAAPQTPPTFQEIKALIQRDPALRNLSAPLHLLVSGERGRTRTQLVSAHLQTNPLPPGSVVRLTESVSCVSPEHLAVQMAPLLTHLELTTLLSELMGTYAIDPSAEGGMTQRDLPLMTPESLLAHLSSLGPKRGTAAVRRALADACVGSASPRETKLTLRLSLKPARGGQHLHVLSMNEPLEVRRIQDRMKTGIRRPDILIGRRDEAGSAGERRIVALEYHGGWHDSPERLARDAERSNELKAMGISEYVVRREQYRDLDYMIGLADAIRRDLGDGPRRLSRAERERRRRLSLELYLELERIDGVHWGGRERMAERAAEEAGGRAPYDSVPREIVPVEAYGIG